MINKNNIKLLKYLIQILRIFIIFVNLLSALFKLTLFEFLITSTVKIIIYLLSDEYQSSKSFSEDLSDSKLSAYSALLIKTVLEILFLLIIHILSIAALISTSIRLWKGHLQVKWFYWLTIGFTLTFVMVAISIESTLGSFLNGAIIAVQLLFVGFWKFDAPLTYSIILLRVSYVMDMIIYFFTIFYTLLIQQDTFVDNVSRFYNLLSM